MADDACVLRGGMAPRTRCEIRLGCHSDAGLLHGADFRVRRRGDVLFPAACVRRRSPGVLVLRAVRVWHSYLLPYRIFESQHDSGEHHFPGLPYDVESRWGYPSTPETAVLYRRIDGRPG